MENLARVALHNISNFRGAIKQVWMLVLVLRAVMANVRRLALTGSQAVRVGRGRGSGAPGHHYASALTGAQGAASRVCGATRGSGSTGASSSG